MIHSYSIYKVALLLLFLLTMNSAFAQEFDSTNTQKRIIQILQANLGTRSEEDGNAKRRLIGEVRIIDGNTKIFCDSAVHYITEGRLEAFGNIQIMENARKIFSDFMTHDLNSDLSTFSGRVLMIEDSTIVLTSEMEYLSDSEVALFKSDFQLYDKDTSLFANRGKYFRVQDSAIVSGNVQSENKDGILTTDSLIISKKNKRSYAIGSVFFKDANQLNSLKSDSLFADSLGYRLAKGNVFSAQIDSSNADTMAVWADQIEIFPSVINKEKKKLFASGSVRQWSDNIAARSDTLMYDEFIDSLTWQSNPIIWQDKSELSAKTIHLKMVNGNPKKLYALVEAKHFSLDSLSTRFNQLAAERVIVNFDTTTSNIQSMQAIGKAEAIYQSTDAQNNADGLVKMAASQIQINFDSAGKAEEVTSLSDITGNYFEEEPSLSDIKLDGFVWNIETKPNRPLAWPSANKQHQWITPEFRIFNYPYDWNLLEELSFIWFPNDK